MMRAATSAMTSTMMMRAMRMMGGEKKGRKKTIQWKGNQDTTERETTSKVIVTIAVKDGYKRTRDKISIYKMEKV